MPMAGAEAPPAGTGAQGQAVVLSGGGTAEPQSDATSASAKPQNTKDAAPWPAALPAAEAHDDEPSFSFAALRRSLKRTRTGTAPEQRPASA